MKQVKCDVCDHVGTGKERSADGCSTVWGVFSDGTDPTYSHDIDVCVKCRFEIQQSINSKIKELRDQRQKDGE